MACSVQGATRPLWEERAAPREGCPKGVQGLAGEDAECWVPGGSRAVRRGFQGKEVEVSWMWLQLELDLKIGPQLAVI